MYTRNDAITHGRLLISVNANGGPALTASAAGLGGLAIIVGRARPPQSRPRRPIHQTDTATPDTVASTREPFHVGSTADRVIPSRRRRRPPSPRSLPSGSQTPPLTTKNRARDRCKDTVSGVYTLIHYRRQRGSDDRFCWALNDHNTTF